LANTIFIREGFQVAGSVYQVLGPDKGARQNCH